MKRSLTGLVLLVVAVACAKVPLTNRKQILLVLNDQMLQLSNTGYRSFLDTSRVINSGEAAQQVSRVGNRIRQAVETYINQNGYSKRLEGFKWEYHLVQDKQVNAWCMPGGKIVVYSGILPYTQNEAELATLLGHGRHGTRRILFGPPLRCRRIADLQKLLPDAVKYHKR